MNALRPLLGLVVLALAAWMLYAVFGPEPSAAPPGEYTSSQQCRACHEEVFAEWEGSGHAGTWLNPDVRALSFDFEKKDCIDCHAPRPVFETGVGNRVLPRSARRNEGVDCIACHSLPEGGVAGTIASKTAACRPVERRELQRPDFCGVCHNQHKTVDQWLETPFAEQGIGCVECHMPHKDGDQNLHRTHHMPGAHDLEFVRSAVDMRAAVKDGRWVVEIQNVGAGHHFPTDERSRAADVFWRPVAEGADAGEGDWRFLHRLRSPYRDEVDVPDTLLPYGDPRPLPIEEADASAAIEVLWVFRRTPYYLDLETKVPIEHGTITDPLAYQVEVLRRGVYQP